jgi:hypothetical protein
MSGQSANESRETVMTRTKALQVHDTSAKPSSKTQELNLDVCKHDSKKK